MTPTPPPGFELVPQGVPPPPPGFQLSQPPTVMQKFEASPVNRLVRGMKDPIDAYAQVLVNALPSGAVDAVNRGVDYVNNLPVIGPVTQVLGMTPSTPQQMNTDLAGDEQRYQQSRAATGQTGMDAMRFTGNVVSPVNAAVARVLPIPQAASTAKKVGYGAGVGAFGGASQPVLDPQAQENFWGTKGIQAGVGAVSGAVLTPIISKVAEGVTRQLSRLVGPSQTTLARASLQTDEIIDRALLEVEQTRQSLPADFLRNLRQEVNQALQKGRQLDAAALLRRRDFDELGVPSTLGQITRDPTQFARERNLRGVAGVGEPLLNRFEVQNRALSDRISQYGGANAGEAQTAGTKLAAALRETDEMMRGKVSGAYQSAREASGRDLDVPLQGLAQDVATVVRDYGKANVPSAVRARLSEYGVFGGRQTKVFTVNDAEEVLQQINKVYDPMKKAEAGALDALRSAVKKAVTSADDQGGVFAAPRNLAAQRFTMHDLVPALRDASEGRISPDRFVNTYLVNGETKDVKMLAELLRQSSPEGFQEARNQVGAQLYRAAFGENPAGDKLFRPEMYAKALRALGTEKLKAFYTAQEVDQLQRVARVGAYINSTPGAAAVNTSNTASAALNLLQKIPGIPAAASILAAGLRSLENQKIVSGGVNAAVPSKPAPLTPEQIRLLSYGLSAGSLASGQAAAAPIR